MPSFIIFCIVAKLQLINCVQSCTFNKYFYVIFKRLTCWVNCGNRVRFSEAFLICPNEIRFTDLPSIILHDFQGRPLISIDNKFEPLYTSFFVLSMYLCLCSRSKHTGFFSRFGTILFQFNVAYI